MLVMPGFMPGIHVLLAQARKTWMAGTGPGHDGRFFSQALSASGRVNEW
jgi:hypothetical protein